VALARDNAKPFIMVRLSGLSGRAALPRPSGFGAIGESMGGMRYITGYPDRAGARAFHRRLACRDVRVIGALMALHHRHAPGGQVVDVALYEAVFAMRNRCCPAAGRLRRERSGLRFLIVPSNTYPCRDGSTW
jgi:formyl-CoA transferase